MTPVVAFAKIENTNTPIKVATSRHDDGLRRKACRRDTKWKGVHRQNKEGSERRRMVEKRVEACQSSIAFFGSLLACAIQLTVI